MWSFILLPSPPEPLDVGACSAGSGANPQCSWNVLPLRAPAEAPSQPAPRPLLQAHAGSQVYINVDPSQHYHSVLKKQKFCSPLHSASGPVSVCLCVHKRCLFTPQTAWRRENMFSPQNLPFLGHAAMAERADFHSLPLRSPQDAVFPGGLRRGYIFDSFLCFSGSQPFTGCQVVEAAKGKEMSKVELTQRGMGPQSKGSLGKEALLGAKQGA